MFNDLPEPSPDAVRHSQELSERIAGRIRADGPLSFADYMQAALYEPGLGYYVSGAQPFGEGGDFVTAPELSPLFSRCLAGQCLSALRDLPEASILEFGAGSGAMAAEILAYLSARDRLPWEYLILEPGAALRRRQHEILAERVPECLPRVRWLSTLEGVRFTGVVLANEVLDAIPVHRFRVENDGRVYELCVDLDAQQRFVWAARPAAGGLRMATAAIAAELGRPWPADFESEICLYLPAWLESLSRAMDAGIVLLVDYGYPRAEYYLPERDRGTLICHYRHRAHDDPFARPGLQDVTAFVDFTAAAEAAFDAGFEVSGFADQAGFLVGCGIESMLQEQLSQCKGDTARCLGWTQQVKTLLLPSEMGERFKVLALNKAYNAPPAAFAGGDRRHRL